MRIINFAVAMLLSVAFAFGSYAEIGHGTEYDCHANDGYGQLGDMTKEQFWFGALKGFTVETYCHQINEFLGFEKPEDMIPCTIISRDSAGNSLPANTVWDAYYTKNWTDHPAAKRDCNRPAFEMCGTSTINGIMVIDGKFPFKCMECKAEFLAKVKHIDCELDLSITDHKNRLVLEKDHLIIKAAPNSDGNDGTALKEDLEKIFPSVPAYFDRMGWVY